MTFLLFCKILPIQVAPGSQSVTQAAATRTPANAAFSSQYSATTAPQTPPKKGVAAGRGVPPPIPPNKPVIPSKQTPSRRMEGATEADKKKTSLPGSKEVSVPVAVPADGTRTAPPGIEMLGQELADFQQMFVTMATSNNT